MLHASFRRRLAVLVSCLLLVAMSLPWTMHPKTAFAHTTRIVDYTPIDDTQKFPAWGTIISYLDGIDVYSNGASSTNADKTGSYGWKYQCVELVQRFFAQHWGTPKTWSGVDSAFQMFENHPSGVQAIKNGNSPGPMRGDALVFNTANGFPDGHVAIVTDVSGGYVYFAQQNWLIPPFHWGQDRLPISDTNSISSGDYPSVLGWLHDTNNTGLPLTPMLRLEIAVPGISNVGSDNNNPQHPNRQINVRLYDMSGQKVFDGSGFSAYDNTRGVFKSIINLGSLSSGLYKVEVWMPYTLHKVIPGPYDGMASNDKQHYNVFGKGVETYLAVGMQSQGIATKQGDLVWGFQLISGDLNQDGNLDTLDYNIFLSCFGTKQCPPDQKAASDLNDDGKVDGTDYNILLKDFKAAGSS